MGTRQSRSGRGQHRQQGDRAHQQQSASSSRTPQQGGAPSQQRTSATTNRQDQQSERQQSQLGGGRDFTHKMENEGREQNREQQEVNREQSAQGASAKQADRQQSGQNVYGEGNYAASRQYDKDVKDFAESGRVEPAARAAAPKSDDEAREMEAAEQEGKRHSKGEDPALTRGPSRQPPESPGKPRPGHEEK